MPALKIEITAWKFEILKRFTKNHYNFQVSIYDVVAINIYFIQPFSITRVIVFHVSCIMYS